MSNLCCHLQPVQLRKGGEFARAAWRDMVHVEELNFA
jgi:hypothetical protein